MNSVRVHPGAVDEAEQAMAWYDARLPGLGSEFILDVDAAIERAARAPLAYQSTYQGVRRILIRRFPFAIYFTAESGCIEVFAILHQHRAPGLWKSRKIP